MYGRILFGTSAVMFGVVALLWRHSDMWQRLLLLPGPVATGIAWCLAIAQITGGVALLHPRTARFGSIALGAVYALFTLACIPGIVHAPTAYVQYGAFFEQLCPACGALAVYAATEPDARRSATLGRASRLGLGLCAISFALAQLFYLQFTASLVPAWIPPNQLFWAIVTTIAFVLAAVAILLDRQARLAIRLLTVMLALFGVLVWIPHIVARPQALSNWSEFAETFLIAGAAWVVGNARP